MRIAMVHTPFWGRAGGERQILRLAIELQKIGHEVEVFTNAVNEETFPDFFKQLTVNVIPHPMEEKMPKWLVPAETYGKSPSAGSEKTSTLRTWMRRHMGRQFYTIPYQFPCMLNMGQKIPKRFDVVNNHNFPTEWAAFFAKKRLKAPVVWMCNEPPYWFFVPELRSGLRKLNWPLFELLDRVAANYVDEICVLSQVAAGFVRKAYDRSATVVRTGVDTELFHNASGKDLRRKYDLENDFVMLFVGGSSYARRSELVRALYHLSKSYDHVKLILDVPARQRETLTKLSEELGIRNRILFFHSGSDKELAEVYAACDVFVYPSSISPWGLVVTEAMAAAKPVIVSKQVGTSEIIQNGANGLIIDQTRPEQIAKQVETLMNNPKLCREIGQNAYEYVKTNLSWEKYAREMERVFQRAISNYRGCS